MITFSAVTKKFLPDETGVSDISFSVSPGEMVFITGPSGSGKTTVMRLLTREYSPTSGEIEFEGQPLSDIREREIHHHRRKIGVVFQDYRLLPELNIWENVALPLSIIGKPQHEIEERVADLLKLVQLTSKAELFPRQLSGGEAQRISIARALAIAPKVICADEPTGNLDRDTATNIAHLLHTINKLGTTVFFATHDPHIISLFADKRRVHLEEGKLKYDTKSDSAAEKSETKPKKSAKTEQKKPEPTDDEPDVAEETEVNTPGFFARWFGKKTTTPRKSVEEPTQKPAADDKSASPSTKTKVPVSVKVESLDEEDEL